MQVKVFSTVPTGVVSGISVLGAECGPQGKSRTGPRAMAITPIA